MKKIISLGLIFILVLSFTACATEIISTDAADENVILVEDDTLESEDIIVYKTGDGDDTNGSEYYDWYGYNAAVLASGDNAVITIESADISTDAYYASAVFAYGGGITITSASITTLRKNSGGLMVTGGGIIVAKDVNISTSGQSSAPIRSDRGGGSISVTGGIYTASGKGSPAIYSTASITVSSADLLSENSQGVVIEGGNSVTLISSDISAYHELNGQDKTHQAVLIYQSGSGDASEGEAEFSMTAGSLINYKGDIFCVTNTSCDITLSGVDIMNADESGNFLRAEGQNWGKSGSNGGNVTLTTSAQTMEGDIIVSSDSSLLMTLMDKSSFKGSFNPNKNTSEEDEVSLAAAGGEIYVILEKGSKITLTGNSYITSWDIADSNDITYGSYSIAVGSNIYTASTPYSPSSSSNSGSSGSGSTGSGDVVTTPIISPDVPVIGPANVGCNLGYTGMILLACAALIVKKK